jgi:hypothetical protein
MTVIPSYSYRLEHQTQTLSLLEKKRLYLSDNADSNIERPSHSRAFSLKSGPPEHSPPFPVPPMIEPPYHLGPLGMRYRIMFHVR